SDPLVRSQSIPHLQSPSYVPDITYAPRTVGPMDLIGIIVSLGVSLLLIVACGAFVAAEFSLTTTNRNDVEAAVESGDKRARGVLQGMKTLSTQLSGSQLGITVTNLGIGFLAEPAIASIIAPPVMDAGLTAVMARTVAVAIALILA